MQVCFHFDENALGSGARAIEFLLKHGRRRDLKIRSRLYGGSLLIHTGAEALVHRGRTTTSKTNLETLESLTREWLTPQPFCWFGLLPRAVEVVSSSHVYCTLFETIEPRQALQLHSAASKALPDLYLGALQVDECLPSHLAGYQLMAMLRVDGKAAYVTWDGLSPDSKQPWLLELLHRVGFDPVDYEDVSAKFTIFDRHGGCDSRLRSAQCRRSMVELFDGVVDSSLVRIRDAMPDVHERLWATLRGFETASVDEQFTSVALGCRRLIEYAADCLFPPKASAPNERKLDKASFKNRLLKYLEECQVERTDVRMIEANLEHAAACVDRLLELANRGVHSSSTRDQARRCILGTVILLDDLCNVNRKGFAVRISLNTEAIEGITGKHSSP